MTLRIPISLTPIQTFRPICQTRRKDTYFSAYMQEVASDFYAKSRITLQLFYAKSRITLQLFYAKSSCLWTSNGVYRLRYGMGVIRSFSGRGPVMVPFMPRSCPDILPTTLQKYTDSQFTTRTMAKPFSAERSRTSSRQSGGRSGLKARKKMQKKWHTLLHMSFFCSNFAPVFCVG